MIDLMSSDAFNASCRAPAGGPVNPWRCGGTFPSYSMKACEAVFALAHFPASVLNAPFGPIHGALGDNATSSVDAVRQ